jgi:hypothetical protein
VQREVTANPKNCRSSGDCYTGLGRVLCGGDEREWRCLAQVRKV